MWEDSPSWLELGFRRRTAKPVVLARVVLGWLRLPGQRPPTRQRCGKVVILAMKAAVIGIQLRQISLPKLLSSALREQ
jgi:hypothetical protein